MNELKDSSAMQLWSEFSSFINQKLQMLNS